MLAPFIALLALLLSPNIERPAVPGAERFECLRAAYPDAVRELAVDDAGKAEVVLADGTRLPWDDGKADKTPAERLETGDIEDMLAMPYPLGPGATPPGKEEDPGRVRFDPLFKALYGKTQKQVGAQLVDVAWMPQHGGGKLKFNKAHGAAAALARVSADLDKLPPELHKYVRITAGTFNWRTISGTERLSAHSYAIAIDINVKFTHYWRWTMAREPDLPWHNNIPNEIVEVFERHGFIWGGKWYHYDTMHFEYRPEMLQPACVIHR